MPLITRTERTDENAGLGIANPITAYNATPQHLSWSPVTMLVYLNWHGGAACLIDRSQTSSFNGLRFNISSTTGNHWFAARWGSGNHPVKYANSPNTAGQWRHIAAVWTGSHLASSITLYHADAGGSITPSGSSSATDGSATSLYPAFESSGRGLRLYNQSISGASDWPTRADVAYIAVWKRALTQSELEQARSEGPLNVHPSDLVLLRANGTDLSGYGATTFTEPAFPDGDLPPILTLGGAVPLATAPISRALAPESVALPDPGLTVGGISRIVTPADVALPTIDIRDDFERSSINPALSSVGVSDISGDEAGTPLVVLRQRLQTVNTMGSNRWLEPCAKLTGVQGLRPRIEIVPFGTAGNNRNHQTWYAAQRAHYSYDGLTWFPISSKTYTARLTWRHSAPFEQDTVYVARSWPRSVTQVGEQIAALAAAHPTLITPAPSATDYTPSNPHGFPAPAYICDEVSAKTDELGRSVPITPLYGFVIDDQAYGAKRKTAVITMGIHSGEDLGEVVGWEMISYLLGNSASAIALRQQTRVLVYPLANPAGRFAGYWRGAPGSNADTNREWNLASPTHDCVTKLKAAILSDVASYAKPVGWAFDVHASPGGGGKMQLGINAYRPADLEFDALVRAKYPAGSWADYSDRNVVPGDPATSSTITGFHRRDVAAKLVMLNETTDIYGPISPTIMRPYAEAQVDALADMDAAGWFDEAPAGTLAAQEAGADAAAIAGAVIVAGVLSAAETGADTAVASGTVTITGTMAVSEQGADTASIVGGSILAGYMAAQEAGSDTAAASGAVIVSGAMAASEAGADGFAASGSVGAADVIGNFAAMESGADTISVSGVVVVSGALAATEIGGDTMQTTTAEGCAPAINPADDVYPSYRTIRLGA